MKTMRIFETVGKILSVAIFLCGIAVLIGWIFNIGVLKSIAPGFVTMKANTAICFLLIGVTLWLSREKYSNNYQAKVLFFICTTIIFLIGAATFYEYICKIDLHIDQLLFKEEVSAVLTSSPGRMAVNTSLCFIFIGMALFMSRFKSAFFSYLGQIFIVIEGIIAFISTLGYVYHVSPLFIGLHFSTAMALHTAILFILTCICFLFFNVNHGFMKNISSEYSGGLILRQVLPIIILIPPFLGWLKLFLERNKIISNELGVSLVAVANLGILSGMLYFVSNYLNRIDSQRAKAREDLDKAFQDLKDIQINLTQASKMAAIGQLSAGVAHEINNPLTGVLNNVQLLKMQVELNQELKPCELNEQLSNIEKAALRCKNIVQSLLDIAHVSQETKMSFSIAPAIEKVLEVISQEIKLSNIAIQIYIQPDLPNIEGNPQLLQQVMLALISNAKWAVKKKFESSGEGKIIIRISNDPKCKSVVLTISDNGIGIPESNKSKLFTHFFTTKEVGEGIGIGLALVYSIVKNHKGDIAVESQVGSGTTFIIKLPSA
jgi:signal transduction histidine kinase